MAFKIANTGRGGTGNIKAASGSKDVPFDTSQDPDDQYEKLLLMKAKQTKDAKPVRLFHLNRIQKKHILNLVFLLIFFFREQPVAGARGTLKEVVPGRSRLARRSARKGKANWSVDLRKTHWPILPPPRQLSIMKWKITLLPQARTQIPSAPRWIILPSTKA